MGKFKAILAILIVGFVAALIVFNVLESSGPNTEPWNMAMTQGNRETGKHFVVYTDVFCPYCDKFGNALHANAAEFAENYIDNGKVFFELRVTEINHRSGHSANSRLGGETNYCAARQDKFWPYYEALLGQLFADYHSKGIGIDKDAAKIPKLENSYFYAVGEKAGLDGEAFASCVENHEALDELISATDRTLKIIPGGIPYFAFGDYRASGFSGNWNTGNDWHQAKLMLDAGL